MNRRQHAERLEARRAAYADRKHSNALRRRADALLAADPSLGTVGNAMAAVFREIEAASKAERAAYLAAAAAAAPPTA